MWRIVLISFNLKPPTSVHNLFTGWFEGLNRKRKSQIIVGASTICWALWLTRNDVVFDKAIALSCLQVIFKEMYWTRYQTLLQKEEDRHFMKAGCRAIETAAMEVFTRHGWRFSNRIALQSFLLRILLYSWPKTSCLRFLGLFLLACNNEQPYVFVEAGILIYSLFKKKA